jgi:hypothetical protein
MLTVARAYELQTLYEQAQWAALDANMAFSAADGDVERASAARRALARIRFVSAMGRALEGDYDDILQDLPRRH